MTGITSCGVAAEGSAKAVGGVDQPSNDVLAHSGQHKPKKPAVTPGGADLEQVKVKLLALDGTLGARTGILMALPEITIPGDKGVQTVVLLGIGIDDPTIG